MLKVKENNEYKNVDLVYFGETEIEQIYDKNGNLVFDANNEIEDETPISFQGKKSANLKNYRIYGNTETKTRSYSGSAPLSFPIMDGSVSNYRIYGNTENGESVGERTKNLLDINNLRSGAYAFADGVYTPNSPGYLCTQKIPCEGNTTYVFSFDGDIRLAGFLWYDENDTYISYINKSWNGTEINRVFSAVSPINAAYLTMDYASRNSQDAPPMTNAQIEQNTDKSSYEPYGYKISITNNNENANIYLDEPLKKQGNNADYIDYAEQKRYNADGTSEDVTLPALPAQSSTNSFSVGTIIQPSSVAVDVDEVVSCGDKVTDSQSVNYGKYKIPVTLTADSAETTDIYLDAPLAKSGDIADYIDYAAQKRHNSDGTESSVTLPEIAVTAGTNTFTIGTEVQPSSVEIKGRIKKL